MADQVVLDAALHPHDEGLPNIADGNEDWNSAGLQMLLGQAVQSGSYVRSDSELSFTGHDSANDQVDVTAGVAYLALAGETVDVQSTLGGSSPPAYDTTITANLMPAICVVVPSTQTNLDAQDSTLSQVWLAYATDDTVTGVSAGDVYLRSDDTGSVTAPPHPSVELGSANPDNASADTLTNRFGTPTFGGATMAGDLVPDSDGARDLGSASKGWGAVFTEKASVTNETFIRGTRGSATGSITSGTATNIFDGESKDVRSEFNASQQFIPDEIGEYEIRVVVDLSGSTTANDVLNCRLRNITDSANVGAVRSTLAEDGTPKAQFSFDVLLDSGDAYELQAWNSSSSFTIETQTEGIIKRSVVA